ncbi:unnamed protein product [Heligmosomoides polygyrus]|uniref:Reverse transcriptase domain-containing protein n=1 Tax=Heligmosomoides polygyrus TaxID=6339 RepID=A0A183F4L6_HELPZ|nr:unnamed protein product [Heligmosomoides polygyrus]
MEEVVVKLSNTSQLQPRKAEGIEKFFGINDDNGRLLMDRKKTLKRWHDYFKEISNKITVGETEAALKKMKSGKATGPDDLIADLWQLKGWCSADWLTEFSNQVVAEKKMPESWQQSTTIPIWKKKVSPADCASYRPIRLLSHTVKIFERIVDGRIREVVQFFTNQCGFASGCGTVDAIQAVRLLLEKHCEKQKPVLIETIQIISDSPTESTAAPLDIFDFCPFEPPDPWDKTIVMYLNDKYGFISNCTAVDNLQLVTDLASGKCF